MSHWIGSNSLAIQRALASGNGPSPGPPAPPAASLRARQGFTCPHTERFNRCRPLERDPVSLPWCPGRAARGRGQVRPMGYKGVAPASYRCVSHGERTTWETHRYVAGVTMGQHHHAGCIMGCLPHSAELIDGRACAPVPIGSNCSQSRLIARSCRTQCPAKQPTNNNNQRKMSYA
jgi:hypothetical protein